MKSKSPNYVHKFSINEESYWIKYGGEPKQGFLKKIINLIYQFTHWDFLAMNSVLPSEIRFKNELKNLIWLKSMNLPIPDVVDMSSKHFVTKDIGKPLSQFQPGTYCCSFYDVLMIFHQFHMTQACHGRPALKDILCNEDGHLFLIDFEESHIHCSSKLMARDILLIILESYRVAGLHDYKRFKALLLWKEMTDLHISRDLLSISRWLTVLIFIPKMVIKFKPKNRLSLQLIKAERLLAKLRQSQSFIEA
ncbi:hypothetical protein ACQ7RL_001271 [Photobacterium damselae]